MDLNQEGRASEVLKEDARVYSPKEEYLSLVPADGGILGLSTSLIDSLVDKFERGIGRLTSVE